MTQRIVTTLRSLALAGALSFGLRKARPAASIPQPIHGGVRPEDEGDSWMFERPQTNLSSGAYLLEQEYARASGALSALRSVLSSLLSLPAMSEPAYAAPAEAPLAMDGMLFDEERAPIAVLTNVVAFEDDDLFAEHTFALPRVPAHQETLARVA